MTLVDVAMLVVVVMGGASALLVVTARNVVHAALYLVVALLSVAATFLLLGAEFLAWTQVLVYVGAVIVLILFGLMLTRAPIGPIARETEVSRFLPLLVGVGLFAMLTAGIWMSFDGVVIPMDAPTLTAALGDVLYIEWALPFMALGFFLTVSLIGAIIIARREEGEGPEPQLDPELATARPTPAPTDASASPGVTEPAQEVGA